MIAKQCETCGSIFDVFPCKFARARTCSRHCAALLPKPRPIGDAIARFWSRVDRDGPVPDSCPALGHCWIWTGRRNADGYGQMGAKSFDHRIRASAGAHRIAFFLTHGRWPNPQALHHCDTPPCVNPAHLFEGTPTDNMRDRSRKGRGNHPRGEDNRAHKLTETQVRELRERYARGGMRQVDIGREYGVCQAAVGYIVRGENWKHL